MGAVTNNAVYVIVGTLFDIYLWVLILRIILQVVRADFYNPISQLVWRLTQPITRPLQRVFPKWQRMDTAAAVLLLTLTVVFVHIIAAWLGYQVGLLPSLYYAVLKLAVLVLNLYTFALFVQAIMSWVGPGVSNPAGSILWSMNEPLLRPVRRVLPPMSGLDLSPLVVILALQFVNLFIPLPGLFR